MKLENRVNRPSKPFVFHFFLLTTFCLISSNVFSQPKSDLWSFWDQSDEQNNEEVSHQAWQEILVIYLDAEHPSGINRFNYSAALESEADIRKLKDYIHSLTQIDPRRLRKDEQFVDWINLYNALTVDLVLSEYPVSSITKIKKRFFSFGPWADDIAEIAGQKLTLNDIEHRILRPIWQDYRIHFAVNCASIGCPSLQAEPFLASSYDEQLNQATVEYLSHPRGIRFENNQLILSKIFDWYQVDFGENTEAMLEVLKPYLAQSVSSQLDGYNGKPEYEYDWKLNEP